MTKTTEAKVIGLKYDLSYLKGKATAKRLDLRALEGEITRVTTDIAVLEALDRREAANR